MTRHCLLIEELEGLDGLPPDDERLRHLAGCARCRALLAAYRVFMAGAADVAGARPGEASRHLETVLQGELQRRLGAADQPAPFAAPASELSSSAPAVAPARPAASARRPSAPRSARPWWGSRLVHAAAALAVVAGAFALLLDGNRPAEPPRRLRGIQEPAAQTLRTLPPRLLEDGSLMLAWRTLAGADAYRVTFHGDDLAEMGVQDAGADTMLTLPALPGARFWRVTGMRDGDAQASSRLAPLPRADS